MMKTVILGCNSCLINQLTYFALSHIRPIKSMSTLFQVNISKEKNDEIKEKKRKGIKNKNN